MAVNARRTANRLAQRLRQRFGINLEDTELVEVFFEVIYEEIRTNLEAQQVESPAEGYTVEVPTESGTTTKQVQGVSVTGSIPRGRFR